MVTPEELIIVMGHRDNFELTERASRGEANPLRDAWLPRFLRAGGGVVWLPIGGDGIHHRDGSERALIGSLDVLDLFLRNLEECSDRASVILRKEDVPSEPEPDHIYFLLELEGGRPFQEDYSSGKSRERKLALLRCWQRLGIRSVQLTHNGRNELGDGVIDLRTGGRLSEFGVAVIKELNRLRMVVGVSHLNDEGFFDALETSETPIIASHSNVRAVYDDPRNLSDDQLRALAQKGGIIGTLLFEPLLAEYSIASLLDHIDHAVEVMGGTQYVGVSYLGNDPPHLEVFPKKARSVPKSHKYPSGMGFREQYETLLEGLTGRGYQPREIADIMGGSYLRVLRQVLP